MVNYNTVMEIKQDMENINILKGIQFMGMKNDSIAVYEFIDGDDYKNVLVDVNEYEIYQTYADQERSTLRIALELYKNKNKNNELLF